MLQCIADYYYDKTKKKWTLIAVMIIDQKR